MRIPLAAAAILVALLAVISEAAGSPASIGGMVRAESGRAVPAASVSIADESGSVVASVRSGPAGEYSIPLQRAGTYSMRVECQGFTAFVRTGIVIADGVVYRQDVALVSRRSVPVTAKRLAPSGVPEVDAIREVRLDRHAGERSAGRPGGFRSLTVKSGSNELHGALYNTLGNDRLNARGFFGDKSAFRRNNFGFFVSGAAVRNTTFFSYQWDRLSLRAGAAPGFGASTPVDAFKRGDFQRLLSERQIGTDAVGRPIFDGQVFDPASTRSHRGVPLRDPFPNNAVPLAHPLRSSVAARVIPLLVSPQRDGLEFNVQGRQSGDQTWNLNAPSHHARLDHAFADSIRTGFRLSRTSHPALRNCGGVGGCSAVHDPVRSPEANTGYLGAGFYEDITTHHLRQSVVWVASRNLLVESSAAYDEFHLAGHSISAGADWARRLWGPAGNGLIETDAGPPAINFSGNTRYSPLGNEWGRSGMLANHQYRVSSDVTWIRRRHTIRFGGEYWHRSIPMRGWAANVAGRFNFHRIHTGGFDADGNNLPGTGDPFASFLLGQANSTHFQIPDLPTFSEDFASWRVMDEYRVTENLTVTVGLRFDYQAAIRERDNNMSTFDPNVPNPAAGGYLGAMIFAGHGPGRTGTRTLESPPRDAFGPRVGFAYRVGERNVVRGAYSISYAIVPHARSGAVNTHGFRFHATAVDQTNGRRPAYYLDDGFPQEDIVVPPSIDPSIGNDTWTAAITRDRATLPRVQDWSLTLQRQVTRSTTFEVAYRGHRGSRLITDRRVLGPAANANFPAVLALGPGTLAAPAASLGGAHGGVSSPYRGSGRSVAQALRPFPHMLDIAYSNVPAGNSFFHAMRTRFEKRFSDGANFQLRYDWSKLTDMGVSRGLRSPDGLGQGPQNPADTHSLERGLSAADVPHRFRAAFVQALPFFQRRKAGMAGKLFGGWSVAGIVRVESGMPVNVVMANDLEPFLFNGQKRPDVLSNRVRIAHAGSFDAATDAFYDRSAFADPGPLRFGSASRTMGFVRGFRNVREDFSLFKDAWIQKKFKLRFETQLGNVFNRTVFCDPNRNWSAASFGRVFAQCNAPRSVQVGLRVDF